MSDKNHMPATFVGLPLALASDYDRLFVINAEDDSYKEYSAVGSDKELVIHIFREVCGSSDAAYHTDQHTGCDQRDAPPHQQYFCQVQLLLRIAVILSAHTHVSFPSSDSRLSITDVQ